MTPFASSRRRLLALCAVAFPLASTKFAQAIPANALRLRAVRASSRTCSRHGSNMILTLLSIVSGMCFGLGFRCCGIVLDCLSLRGRFVLCGSFVRRLVWVVFGVCVVMLQASS